MLKKLILISAISILTACGGDGNNGSSSTSISSGKFISGNYVSPYSGHSYVFNKNGTVQFKKNDKLITEYKYSMDGNSIKIEGYPRLYTLRDDGRIDTTGIYGLLEKK